MATIKQIAQLAGVSRGTVDRVLNGRGGVSGKAAQRVREVAGALNYSPNIAGRTLAARKKALRLGYIIFDPDVNEFFAQVRAGIEAKIASLAELGVSVALHTVPLGDHAAEDALLERLCADDVDGIAVTPVNHPAILRRIAAITAAGVPVVTVNSDLEGCGRLAYVGTDDYKSGRTAGALMGLLTGGVANVGAMIGSASILCHTKRLAGFREAAAMHYPDLTLQAVCEGRDDDVISFAAMKAMLEQNPGIDAVCLAAGGAYGACRAIREFYSGGKMPVVISFDCTAPIKKLVQEGIISATIEQQPELQGSRPLDILFGALALGTQPAAEMCHTDTQIRIRENL